MGTPRRIGFDIESNGLLRPDKDKAQMTRIHCIAVTVDNDPPIYFAEPDQDAENGKGEAAGTLEDCVVLLSTADVLYGHNIMGFDLPVLAKFMEWTPGPGIMIRDTIVMARLLWPDTGPIDWPLLRKNRMPRKLVGRHSLKAWGYRLGVLKGEFGEEDEDVWKELSPSMIEYCLQDTEVTRSLYQKCFRTSYTQQSLELEHAFAACIEKQMVRGAWLNPKTFQALEEQLVSRHDLLEEELVALVPPAIKQLKTKTKEIPFNPRSRDQVAKYLQNTYGWEPIEFTPTGKPKMDAETLGFAVKFIPEIAPFSEYLYLAHMVGQMFNGPRSVAHNIQSDGRVHGYVNHNGANTGRCTHAWPNTGNIPSARTPLGLMCRESFGAKRGFKIVGGDAQKLELCALGHYLVPFDGGEYLRVVLSGDAHTHNQKAAGLATRDDAKTFIYALIYGAGDAKLGAIAGGGAALGKRLRARFFKRIPALGLLEKRVKAKAKSEKWLKGLDGRVLWVRGLHSSLNLLLQSFGAIAMKQATVNLHHLVAAQDWPEAQAGMILHVHDEMQWEVRTPLVKKFVPLMDQAFEMVQDQLGMRCPLSADIKIGRNWGETH